MTTRTTRKIIQIDEEKCNGCGNCITACAEGALALVEGKAKLVSEVYCDGLAACVGECPQDALHIVERESEAFDEEATNQHLKDLPAARGHAGAACPGSAVRELRVDAGGGESGPRQASRLAHWPVQLALVPPGARFLEGTDLVLVADCVPFAYPNFHADFLKDHSLLVGCPKLDDAPAHLQKLTEILQKGDIRSLSVVHMEVPCCSGLTYIARQALKKSGKNVPFKEVTIGIKGERKAEAVGV
jgi:Pyruvate/2-oxoacid:ferredoxin oxidoreductase delta subunit